MGGKKLQNQLPPIRPPHSIPQNHGAQLYTSLSFFVIGNLLSTWSTVARAKTFQKNEMHGLQLPDFKSI